MKRPVALAAALLALSGCGNQDPPSPVDPTTPATSAPTKAAPVEPTMPPAAFKNTKDGAVAFARYYWDVVNYAQKTLDTGLLTSLAADTCKGCKGGTDWIDGILRQGGSIKGGLNRVRKVGVPSPARPGHPDWDLSVVLQTSQQVATRPGRHPERYAAGTNYVSMTVRGQNGTWKVAFLEYQ